ncbi:hypothetical protein KBO27_02775 [Saccharopolyspora endophytica]|uniref:Uncharacterized protein n=1 Tax=Saccharopolyspora endophytica TaxID=543886 RepID=A0ABS5D986_9PSEU|nr:hypothetical protein [Saccharopolyspora endophytica]MBQ0922851.1 hypothetical protein [Saccharopolyspora endophytica]
MAADDVGAEGVVDLLPGLLRQPFGDVELLGDLADRPSTGLSLVAEGFHDVAEDLGELGELRGDVADRPGQLADDVGDLGDRLGDERDRLRDHPGQRGDRRQQGFQRVGDQARDAVGDQVADELADERDDLAHDRHDRADGARELRRSVEGFALLGGGLAVGVAGGTGPALGVGLDGVLVLTRGLLDGLGDVLPGLAVGGDAVGVPGEPVEGFLERLDVLDQPGQPVGEQGADGVDGEADALHREAAVSEAGLDPARTLVEAGDVVDGLGDADAARPARVTAALGDEAVVALRLLLDERVRHGCTPRISALLESSTCW